jgi:ribosome biogenesis ATPase
MVSSDTPAAAAAVTTATRSVVPFAYLSMIASTSSLAHFLHAHPSPLTSVQLSPISITAADFTHALAQVQPSSKREGFATVPDVTWADIGALHSTREELHMAIVQPIRRPEVFSAVGIEAPCGVLLWGPPGCGKTLLAKAVANESRANFISVKGPELLNKVSILLSKRRCGLVVYMCDRHVYSMLERANGPYVRCFRAPERRRRVLSSLMSSMRSFLDEMITWYVYL